MTTPPLSPALPRVAALVGVYVGVVVATLAALALLTVVDPAQATDEAWGHGLVVALFAVVLLLRLRPARRGDVGALRAVGVIAAVLVVVNLVEALLPGVFPGWMRVEMVGIAVLLGCVVLAVRRR